MALLALFLGACLLVFSYGMHYEVGLYRRVGIGEDRTSNQARRAVVRADKWSLNALDRFILPALPWAGALLVVGGLAGLVVSALR